MNEQKKKTLGRSRIYGSAQPSDGGDREQRMDGSRRSRRAQPIGTPPVERLSAPPGRRRRDLETEAKMRMLWAVLIILIVVLAAAIVYEIVLGYGSLETGSQRMEANALETEQMTETEEQESDTDSESAAEQESGSEPVAVIVHEIGSAETVSEGETETEPAETASEGETETETEMVSAVNTDSGQTADAEEGTSLSDGATLAGVSE